MEVALRRECLRRTLAGKLLAIGKEVLKLAPQDNPAGNGTKDAIKWIQRAFCIIEPLEDAADPGEGQLKVSLLSHYSMPVTRSRQS